MVGSGVPCRGGCVGPPRTSSPFGGDINVTVDLSNYATKDDIKNMVLEQE